jgi:tRNA pseudouridine38-40 synthase
MQDDPQTASPVAAARNIKLVVAYNGAAYHGWQRQAPGVDTVQERIEMALARVLGHPITLHGAGRTDAGVHALGQTANFRTPVTSVPLEGLRLAVNSRLPHDIAIVSADEAGGGFHASRSAIGKTYLYRIHRGPTKPVHLWRQVYHFWRPLDVELMRAAAVRVIGRHDFRGFATSAEEREDTVRTVFRCEVEETPPEIHVRVQGDGFLYNMVRNIVGTLIEIARGRWDPQRIDLVLATADRRNAGPTAPPDGLYLECVHYDWPPPIKA